MRKKLVEIINKHSSLAEQMADPEVFGDQEKLTNIAKEHSSLEDLVRVSKRYIKVLDLIIDDKEMLDTGDEELIKIAEDEIADLESELEGLEEELKVLLLPKNPNDDKNLILEIRAGTGGRLAYR